MALELEEEVTGSTWVRADANTGNKASFTAYLADLLFTTQDAD